MYPSDRSILQEFRKLVRADVHAQRPAPGGGAGTLTITDDRTGDSYRVRYLVHVHLCFRLRQDESAREPVDNGKAVHLLSHCAEFESGTRSPMFQGTV